MSDSALRSACHPPLLSSASISLSLRLSECLSVFFCLPLPLHLLPSFSFSFQSCSFMGEKWRCDFLEELRYNRQPFLFFPPTFLIFTLLYLCCVCLLMRADVTARQCVFRDAGRFFEMQNQGENRRDKIGKECNTQIKSDIITVLEINQTLFTLMNNILPPCCVFHSQKSKD